ncbi:MULTISPECIES: hypothetical protein [Dyella]|uniref:hypothetical protein n=1 Tax=Dyella TaxID=231454 RepID=UPI00197AFC5C|nr:MULTISPECIES: hypothetical protein [Dyella]
MAISTRWFSRPVTRPALDLQTKLADETDRRVEVLVDDAYVVHALDGHVMAPMAHRTPRVAGYRRPSAA